MKGSRPLRSTRRMTNLGQRPGWFTLKNQAEEDSGPLLVHIYDEIGLWGTSAQDFVNALTAHDGDLEMHINSPGGDIFDGIAIYNVMKQRSGTVSVVIDGLAASAASFIAQAASPGKLTIAPHAQMMIHDGFAMAIGNAADMRDTADLLDKASDNIASIYAERTGRDAAYWRERMRLETWYTDQEAVDSGLADAIHGPASDALGSWNLAVFNTWRPQGAMLHAPYTGSHTHDHPSYGHAGASNAASHSHEHAHDSDCDHDHHEEPDADDGASNLNQLILNAAVDESAWDGPRAMREAGESSPPKYAKICAGRRDGPSNERGSWALPHHYPDKDAPNAAGVKSALGYLSRTQGLTNADAAKAHLHAHMKAINPDWEPDDFNEFEVWMEGLQEVSQ